MSTYKKYQYIATTETFRTFVLNQEYPLDPIPPGDGYRLSHVMKLDDDRAIFYWEKETLEEDIIE